MSSQFTFDFDSPSQEIPYGYCRCGCGKPTLIAKQTDPRSGRIKGQPSRYLIGHARRNSVHDVWKHVKKGLPDECWPYTGFCRPDKYGKFRCGKEQLAHRSAWISLNGPIPKGLDILHTCDNPPCCNGRHLFPGTHAENMADMAQKGRAPSLKGEKHPMAKLTNELVMEIRRLREEGWKGTEIARLLGIKQCMVSTVYLRKTWKHLP